MNNNKFIKTASYPEFNQFHIHLTPRLDFRKDHELLRTSRSFRLRQNKKI
jgi:hypothetical protein